jgi:hypothetical protein
MSAQLVRRQSDLNLRDQRMTNPDKSDLFIPQEWKLKKNDLKSYLGSDMHLNTLSLQKFENGAPESAKYTWQNLKLR